ncbi:MAG: pcrA [Conexibacter sp.]|nr:pcrA [Conexibacter sp.]
MLAWTTRAPERTWLRERGYAVLTWERLNHEFVQPARDAALRRRGSLSPPAQPLVQRFAQHDGVAILDVHLTDGEALRALHDYVLRPAWRTGCRILIHADLEVADLGTVPGGAPEDLDGLTLERTQWLAALLAQTAKPPTIIGAPTPSRPLDPEQLAAVGAGDGVVQIIAPAGSGKTTVLVERTRELLRRGTPRERILCTTFNKAAANELRERLERAGVTGVHARTFHSLGRTILSEEGLLRGETRSLSLAQWRRLSAQANRSTGTWIEPPQARAAISQIKLAHLATADEWKLVAPKGDGPQAVAAIYTLYEQQMRKEHCHDFDDQIMLAIRALRCDADIRRRWQARYHRVLVDEYQDIEPAQELLVQILAAPQDSLFCVGDEDQTLYGWRRASVTRIVGLDQTYPSLERIALATNYRCPPEVVERSAQLIQRNTLRFPKAIAAAPGKAPDPQAVTLQEHASPDAAAEAIARRLAQEQRGDVVVLARTTRQLRTVALACLSPGVRIGGPDAIFEARAAQATLEAHLRLAIDPETAEASDVAEVLRHPSRGMASDAESTIAERLRHGMTWRAAVAGQGTRDDSKLDEAAGVLDALAGVTDAQRFVRTLRGPFGLDRHFTEYEETFGGPEQVEIEALADAERQAAGRSVLDLARLVDGRRSGLAALRDEERGIELCTVHGGKGREWPTVILFGFDDGQMPHSKALDVSAAEIAAGEGEQAERRVAYVAMTRASRRLIICHSKGKLSPFGWQAGLAPEPRPSAPPTAAPRSTSRSERRAAPLSARRGRDARDIIRDAPDQPAGLRLAAGAIEGKLGDCGRIALEDLLIEAPRMSRKRAREILDGTGADLDTRNGRLDDQARRRVVDAVLEAAEGQ